MKLIKHSYTKFLSYGFCYLPIFLSGIFLFYYWPAQVAFVIKAILPLFLLLSIWLVITPAGNYVIYKQKSQKCNFIYWIGLWLVFQLSLSIIYLEVRQTVMGSVPIIPAGNPTLFSSFLQSGFYPWPLYTLLGLAFAYSSSIQGRSAMYAALHPLFKKTLDSDFGSGIELFIKQSIIFVCSVTIGILISQLSELISFFLYLPSPIGYKIPTILLSSVTFFLLASPLWRRTTRFLGSKHFSFGTILAFVIFFMTAISLLVNLGIKFITPYFYELFQLPLQHGGSSTHPWQMVWFFFSLIWWTAWAPVAANVIRHLAQTYSMRTTILVSLLFPSCFAVYSWLAGKYAAVDHFALLSTTFLSTPLSELFLTLLSMLGIIFFFQSPHELGIVHSARLPGQPISVFLIRNVALLITSGMIIYITTGISYITLFAAGAAIPVFSILLLACLGLILFAPYRHFVEK